MAAAHGFDSEPILAIRDLEIAYRTEAGVAQAVRKVSFDLFPNQCLALIGESGCGKTTLGLGLLQLLPSSAAITGGSVAYRHPDGRVVDVASLDREALRRFRWQQCAMVFQGAQNSLNPLLRVREHMLDTVRAHRSTSRAQVRERAEIVLRQVQLEPRRVLDAYPHELSGGMRQRVLIAMALLLDARVLILDEPTTALDILTQRAILDVLRGLREQARLAMIFISHDLGIAAELADRVATMYAGRVIEEGPVREIFQAPRHPYTVSLMEAVPPVRGDLYELASIPGAPPNLLNLPSGCPFHPRCPQAHAERCPTEDPPLEPVGADDHVAACHWWRETHLERTLLARDA